MFRKILSVGGFTLLSRLSGFIRDIVLAAVLGAGALMDAFSVALRLPNHFRTIFGEGAVNQAYIPAYARVRQQAGEAAAALFANRIFTLNLIVQVVLLALALPFMPEIVRLLAPGFSGDPQRFELAVALTRITFPYLLFITLVTLLSANLNAIDRYAAAAGAPILLNVCLVAALAIAFLFPSAAYAAAWGVAVSGVLQWLLVAIDARRAGVGAALVAPRIDADVKSFLKAFGPAVIGSAGVQIALFADTIIASLLPRGAYSALYYAERLYQLPIGVIAIGVGTVLLPTMSRLLAAGNVEAADKAQNRAVALTLVMAAPFAAAFLAIPELIVSALFERGRFDSTASQAAGAVLFAYAVGLPAIVLIRSQVSAFQARGDTTTPMMVSLAAIACNVGLKLLLWRDWGAPGLALATAAGAWINLGLLFVLALRRGWTKPDRQLPLLIVITLAGAVIAAVAARVLTPVLLIEMARFPAEVKLVTLAAVGAVAGLLYLVVTLGGLKAARLIRLLR
ncbi:murein biosynthesis integral membrane protein MurJ [Bosea caraganae]|uniref:Probable lipid II flippase MurJ n=1 Tax=Bosea caraganae TaxID=2763117 RepID=A0A370L401_9HYPH|nr:murein biosynthesis integral membrane protein MurJ [Bosea caraganae]RDJ23559.1 murein biosynthesis integral membrane protein MurJ [Bosea caraganae]RDJ24375.1 murein biosynthesis integral membrane protein MurJ [Bosea caraganae]